MEVATRAGRFTQALVPQRELRGAGSQRSSCPQIYDFAYGARSESVVARKKSALVVGWKNGLEVLSRDVFGSSRKHVSPSSKGSLANSKKNLRQSARKTKGTNQRPRYVTATAVGEEAITGSQEKKTPKAYRPVVILPVSKICAPLTLKLQKSCGGGQVRP